MNKVSLWVGSFQNEEDMKIYFQVKYSEDGERENSVFENKFSLVGVNDYTREVAFFDTNKNSIRELIKGCSYEEEVVLRFENILSYNMEIKANTVALLYEYNYQGDKLIDSELKYHIQYIGTVDYYGE